MKALRIDPRAKGQVILANGIFRKTRRLFELFILAPFVVTGFFLIHGVLFRSAPPVLLIFPGFTAFFIFLRSKSKIDRGETFVAVLEFTHTPALNSACAGRIRFFFDPVKLGEIRLSLQSSGVPVEALEISAAEFIRGPEGWESSFSFSRLSGEGLSAREIALTCGRATVAAELPAELAD